MSSSENSAPEQDKDPMNRFVYDVVVWIVNIVIDLFFREVHPRSSWRIPRDGPVLFVAAPHANQFIDPAILMRVIRFEAKRRVAFLIAAKSMKRAFIGKLAKLVGALPVSRPMDDAKPQKGKIYLPDPDNDSCFVRGYGTNFEDEKFKSGGRLVLPTVNHEAANAEIHEVVGPEELRLKKPFGGPVALDQLTGRKRIIPDGKTVDDVPKEFNGTDFKFAQKVDQSGIYRFVADALGQGGCIGMFPEGGSHDRSELLPLKAGVAIMALETLAKYPDCELKVVPCGMNYFHAHKFRSRCVVEFGPPVQISKEVIHDYKRGNRREVISNILDSIHIAIKNVTINTPDYETLMMIQAARRLYRPKGKKIPLTAVVELNRRLMKGYERYKDDPRIVKLRSAVMAYNKQLLQLQIRDHQVKYASVSIPKTLWLLVSRLVKLAVMSILVIPGAALFAPVFALGKMISNRKSKEALAASAVKIEGKDVMATWKLLVALAAAPTFYVFYTVLFTWWYSINHIQGLITRDISLSKFAMLALIFFASMSFAALRIGETGMDIFKSIRPLIVALSPWHGRQLSRLRQRREALAAQVTQVINTLGPEIFPDFEKQRIIRPENAYEDSTLMQDNSSDALTSEPSTPTISSHTQFSHFNHPEHIRHLPRNESLHDISNIPMFASRPASRPTTPRHWRGRSRSGSFGGAGDALKGFTPLASSRNMEELHESVVKGVRERNQRRKSESGEWESGASSPSSEFGGLTMSKKER